mgnify:CR=1 FL=1
MFSVDLKKRLKNIVQKDKENNPKYLIDVIKSDFFYLINNYFEVNFEDILLDIQPKENSYEIIVNCVGDRMKLARILPE